MSEVKFIKRDRYVGPNGEDLGPVETEETETPTDQEGEPTEGEPAKRGRKPAAKE